MPENYWENCTLRIMEMLAWVNHLGTLEPRNIEWKTLMISGATTPQRVWKNLVVNSLGLGALSGSMDTRLFLISSSGGISVNEALDSSVIMLLMHSNSLKSLYSGAWLKILLKYLSFYHFLTTLNLLLIFIHDLVDAYFSSSLFNHFVKVWGVCITIRLPFNSSLLLQDAFLDL